MSVPKAELKRWPVKGPSLRELFVGELRGPHDVENRLIKALPKLAKRANSGELRSGLELIWHKRTNLSNASSKCDISCERQRLAEKGNFCNRWPALESFSFFGRAYASQFFYRMEDRGQDYQ